MNVSLKPVRILECIKCTHIFMVAGDTPIGLAHPRPPTLDPYRQPLTGVCPQHRQKGI